MGVATTCSHKGQLLFFHKFDGKNGHLSLKQLDFGPSKQPSGNSPNLMVPVSLLHSFLKRNLIYRYFIDPVNKIY